MNISRRNFLMSSGVALALPIFESFGASGKNMNAKRMVLLCNNMSLIADNFIPKGSGTNFKPSRYLKHLSSFRKKMTSFSGVWHPEVDGAHASEKSFLTCAPHPGLGSFKNTISLDQYAVDYIGSKTRFPYLALSATSGHSLSSTRAGVPIPGERSAAKLYKKLFVKGSKKEVEEEIQKLRMGKSIMDGLLDKSKRLSRTLSKLDREKFEEYQASVRDIEQKMVRMQVWEKKPRPKVDLKQVRDIPGLADVTGKSSLFFDLIHLALKTDSTRIVTMNIQGHFIVPPIDGVTEGYHTLSHHGRKPSKLKELALIEDEHMRVLSKFLKKLDSTKEGAKTLLDNTMVLYGSNMGNASSHDTRNLPVMLAGGGFKHGQHLAFSSKENEPLANLFVPMLNNLGIDCDRFGSSTRSSMPGFR